MSGTRIDMKYGNAAIYTSGKMKKTVLFSSTEVNFTLLTEGCSKQIWLRKLMKELEIYQATIAFSSNNLDQI